MRKLFLLLLFLPTLIFAQVPQGVGYQGVATDAAGFELINQSISIRASVISTSATGTIEWQEIHNTSTDTFGLFNLTIGQGTSTGNGAQTSFADITWGANTHFLKIEMDVNGGTNYSHMGTNQMMSVPYALYAENANIDYDSIATILSNDSSFINNFNIGGNMVFGDRVPINFQFISDTTLEIFATQDGFLTGWLEFYNSNISYFYCDTFSGNFTFRAGLSSNSYGNDKAFNFPIKKGDYYRFTRSSYINFKDFYFTPLVTDSSLYTSYNSSNGNGGGGCDINLPEGIYGDQIIHDLYLSSYTVPSGKNLYLTNIYNYQSSGETYIDGIVISKGDNNYQNARGSKPIIASSGQIISSSVSNPGVNTISGFLVDANVIPITQDLFSSSYTVPSGKNLYLTNIYNYQSSGETYIDGIVISKGDNNYHNARGSQAFILKSNQVISSSVSNPGVNTINGYLADENYFADCGGGGGSSSSTVDSSYIDSLVQFYSSGNGGGCDFNYPDGLYGIPVTHDLNTGTGSDYIVPIGKTLYLTNLFCNGGYSVKIDGITVSEDEINRSTSRGALPYILSSGQILSTNSVSANSVSFNGILIENSNVFPLTHDLNNHHTGTGSDYIVPIGKTLYLTNLFCNGGYSVKIDGITVSEDEINRSTSRGALPYILSSGQILSTNSFALNSVSFNGYLADENYFADCGGGGGSSSSTIDSSYIDSLVQFYSSGVGGGCDIKYPDGWDGDPITSTCSYSSPYIVPINTRLYVLSTNTNTVVNGKQFSDVNYGEVMILNSGDSLRSPYGASDLNFNGFLIEPTLSVTAITSTCSYSSPYIVPINTRLYVLSTNTNTVVNGKQFSDVNYGEVMILNSGDSLRSPYGASDLNFNGYLVDENYFADCGGGGSSSSTIDSSYSLNDTVYSGSLSFGAGSSPQSDTISLPYIKGKDIFITGDNLLCFYGCSGSLRIVDDSGFDITAKVIGSKDLACTQCPAGFSISSISQISSDINNNTIQAIIRPYNLTTTNLYLFFDVYSNPSGSGGGTISFQY